MTPSIFQAIVLGVVQGITEFLPISSTGHLRLIPRLLGWSDSGIAFDAALHTGTLIAVLLYFRKDWVDILRGVLFPSMDLGPNTGRRMFFGVIIGTIPVGIAYLLLNGTISKLEHGREYDRLVMGIVATMLIVVAILMSVADRMGRKNRTKLAQIGPRDWIPIGIAQALAIIPGVSRSGATISAGLARGLSRENAARFSFLLSTPAFVVGALKAIKDTADAGFSKSVVLPAVVGALSSALVGILVIKFLLDYLQRRGLGVFVWYRIVLGVVIITLLLTHVI